MRDTEPLLFCAPQRNHHCAGQHIPPSRDILVRSLFHLLRQKTWPKPERKPMHSHFYQLVLHCGEINPAIPYFTTRQLAYLYAVFLRRERDKPGICLLCSPDCLYPSTGVLGQQLLYFLGSGGVLPGPRKRKLRRSIMRRLVAKRLDVSCVHS